MTSEELAFRCAQLIYEKHGEDVRVLDLRGLTDFADFFVIASASSQPHLRSLTDAVLEFLDGAGVDGYHTEGLRGMRWVLVDAVEVVVHLFLPEVREYYDIESYWGDAPMTVIGEEEGAQGD